MKDKSIILTELETISPLVAQIPLVPVFSVPDGYFAGFPEKMALIVRQMEDSNAEITQISPLLAGLNRKMPMQVPDGYFENLSSMVIAQHTEKAQLAPVIPMRKRSFSMFAIAASMVALLGVFSLIYNQMMPAAPTGQVNITAEIPKVSEQEMDNFLNAFPDNDLSEPISSASDEIDIEALIGDINDKGLQEFLSDLPDGNNEKLN